MPYNPFVDWRFLYQDFIGSIGGEFDLISMLLRLTRRDQLMGYHLLATPVTSPPDSKLTLAVAAPDSEVAALRGLLESGIGAYAGNIGAP